MICIDCHKSYESSGLRCIRCSQLFERGKLDDQQTHKDDVTSVGKLKNYKRLIYVGVGFATLDLIKTISFWAMFNYWKAPAKTAPMALFKEYITPGILLLQAFLIVGVAYKSRIASMLLFACYCVGLFTVYGSLSAIVLNPLLLALLALYFLTMVCCFRWHQLKRRLQAR